MSRTYVRFVEGIGWLGQTYTLLVSRITPVTVSVRRPRDPVYSRRARTQKVHLLVTGVTHLACGSSSGSASTELQ